jgi:hypothetical protein
MSAKILRQLRGVALRNGTLHKSLEIEVAKLLSCFTQLSPKQIVAVMTASSILREKFPDKLGRALFASFSSHASSKILATMSDDDFARTVVSYGFLVRRRFDGSDHTRAGDVILDSALIRPSSNVRMDVKTLRNIVKGISLLRLPMSDKLMRFYKEFPHDGLPFEEKVFYCKSAIDYGLLPKSALVKIRRDIPENITQTAAGSLLYCLAIAGDMTWEQEKLKSLLQKSNPNDLVSLWSCHLLGVPNVADRNIEMLKRALESSDMRDREMASGILGISPGDAATLTQSQKHLKLFHLLRTEFPDLAAEFEIAPGIVVDCASVSAQMAFELQGPSHYIFDLDSGVHVLNGPTIFKNKLIARNGWKVRNINLTDPQNVNLKKIREIRFS